MADDLFARARSAGYWTACVTDTITAKRLRPEECRVLRITGSFPTEVAAIAAAEEAIEYGWVGERMIRRETAKACADFNLPREVVNEIGRYLEAGHV